MSVCPDCGGTGADAEKTRKARSTGECDNLSYIRCWSCGGNGDNSLERIKWGKLSPLKQCNPLGDAGNGS